MYNPTFKLLSHLGVKNIEEMTQYKEIRQSVENFENEKQNDRNE